MATVKVYFIVEGCPTLSQEFLTAHNMSSFMGQGMYKLNDYSYDVEEGGTVPAWPTPPDIEGYHKDGWGYYSNSVLYPFDSSEETIELSDTHARLRGTINQTGDALYFSFFYSDESTLPLITYQCDNVTVGTQVLGRFDELNPPTQEGYDFTWNLPSSRPTTSTTITGTKTPKSYNFTIVLVDRPWLYNANYEPSKTYSVQYGTNINTFISSSNDKFIKNWRDYDATEVPLWGTVSESSLPTTMPAADVTYTRTYTVDSEHWHDVTMEFYTRSDDGTVTLESSSIRHLPYGYMIPPEKYSATHGYAHPSYSMVQVQILDGAWHDYYAQKLATGYEFYDVEVNNPGNILESGFTGINGLRDADATFKYYSAYKIASITLKTVDENGDTVSSKTITDRFEGDTLTSTDLEASDVTGKKFVLTPGIESYTISRNDTEIVIGTYRTLYKVYYKLGNKSLKIEKGVSEYDYVECYSGETINENVILLEHDIQSNTTNRYTTANYQDPHIRSFVYPNSVVNKVMPAEDIEVQIDLTYEHNLKIVFNNDTSDVIYSTKIFGGDEINLNYVAPEHLSRNDNVYRFNSLGQIPAVMPDEDVYISATYDLVYCITFATGSSEHITGQKYGYYVAGETIVYPEFGDGDDKMDMYFLMPYGQSGVRECKAIGWADAPETMPAADTTVYAEYEIKKHLNVEIYINNQVDYTFAIAGGYTGDTFDVFETLKNNYRFINYRWVYQGESNQYQDYRVDWNLSNLPETWTVGQSDVVVLTGNAYTRTQYRLICKVQSTGEVIKEYSQYPYTDLNIEDGEYFVYRTYSQNGSMQHDKYEIVNKLDMQVIYDKYTGKYMMPENDLIIYLNPVEVSYVRLYVKDELWKTMVFPKNQYINFISLPIPTIEGYTFLGWRTPDQGDFRQYDRYHNTHDAVVFTAIFKEIEVEPEVYTITYMVDGEVWRTADYEAGQYIPNQLPPAKSGYHFLRWNPQVTQMPQFDVTVEAVYEQNQISDTYYSLEFYIDDTMVYQTEVRGGDVIPQPTVSVPDGKRVVWIGIPEYMPESNLRINGYLDEVTRPLYYINFYLDGTIYQRYGYYEGELVYPAEVPEKQGYVFRGWNNLPASMPANDIDIYGEYAKSDPDVGQKYSVIYKIDGRIWRSVLVDAGTEVGVADFPVREGYVFTGWSVTESFVMPDHDVVISGAFTRSGDAGVYYINYYIPG